MADASFKAFSELLNTSTISQDNSIGRTAEEDLILASFGTRLIGTPRRETSPPASPASPASTTFSAFPAASSYDYRTGLHIVHLPRPASPGEVGFQALSPPPRLGAYNFQKGPESTLEAMEVPAEGPILQAPTALPSIFATKESLKEEVHTPKSPEALAADGDSDFVNSSTRDVIPPSGKAQKRPRVSGDSEQEDSLSEDAEIVSAAYQSCTV